MFLFPDRKVIFLPLQLIGRLHYTEFGWGNPRERGNLEELGRIILKLRFIKQDEKAWIDVVHERYK